jgi:hypothetical protein
MQPDDAPFMHEVALGAHEEFEAAAFISLSGFYRQALGSLRNAFELITHAAALAVANDAERYVRWREAKVEPRFRDSRNTLLAHADALEHVVAAASVFGDLPDGWARRLYRRLCGYAHSQAGSDNAVFWESNGPVYRPTIHRQCEVELREVVAYASICMKLGWQGFRLNPESRDTLVNPGPSWTDVAPGVLSYIDET